jgi:predicted ATPase
MFLVLQNLRMTVKYGLSGGSTQAFAGHGLFLNGPCDDHTGALRLARLARQVLEGTDSKAAKPLTLLTVAFFIEAWSFTRDRILEALQEGRRAGMESGNIEMGFQNWMLCHLVAYHTGYLLEPIENNGEELVEQLQLYSVDLVLSIMLESRLPVLYLLGKADKPLDWDELESFHGEPGNNSETYRILMGYLGRLELAVIFGELETA